MELKLVPEENSRIPIELNSLNLLGDHLKKMVPLDFMGTKVKAEIFQVLTCKIKRSYKIMYNFTIENKTTQIKIHFFKLSQTF